MADVLNEDSYLAAQVACGALCDIFLINGVKLAKVVIIGHDEHCLFVRSQGDAGATAPNLIMKSAITSIVPLASARTNDVQVSALHGVLSNRRAKMRP